MVTKFVKENTCAVDYKREGHRQATSWVIGDCLKSKYIAHSRTFKLKDMVDDIRERFGIQITYNKAWRVRKAAYDTLRVCKDGNNSIFLLAWGIGDVENDSSWLWFFTKFKQVYGDRLGLVIVSDRHPNIAKAIREIYPGAFHEICMQHLLHNIKNKFRGISVDMLYYWCEKAYRLCEFACLMNALTLVQPRLGPYLQEVGYERWSRAYSEGHRYNIMMTKISECINAILVKERELPVTALAEEMRSLDGVVDLQARTCSCRCFQLEQLPCAYAMIAIQHSKRDVYNFCSKYYNSSTWKATYAGVVYPLPHQGDWVIPNKVRDVKVLPPDI
ncbi:hypothetical protein UlMin_009150 [Ulmus minor]